MIRQLELHIRPGVDLYAGPGGYGQSDESVRKNARFTEVFRIAGRGVFRNAAGRVLVFIQMGTCDKSDLETQFRDDTQASVFARGESYIQRHLQVVYTLADRVGIIIVYSIVIIRCCFPSERQGFNAGKKSDVISGVVADMEAATVCRPAGRLRRKAP